VRIALVVFVVGCWGSTPTQAPAPPVPSEHETHNTCSDAAAGLERGTRGIREPDTVILGPMRAACLDDAWPADAIDCFTTMTEDDLGRCAGLLVEAKDRDKLFAALGGSYHDKTAIAIAIARLANVKVGIAECDRFVTVVASVLGCEQMPLAQRVQLGNETADFWSLPTSKLPADAVQRMATVCGQSRASLEQQAGAAGCKP
jgi:hypothetical protein